MNEDFRQPKSCEILNEKFNFPKYKSIKLIIIFAFEIVKIFKFNIFLKNFPEKLNLFSLNL